MNSYTGLGVGQRHNLTVVILSAFFVLNIPVNKKLGDVLPVITRLILVNW